MSDLRDVFGKEFDVLKVKADENYKMLMASIAIIQEIPAINDLEICEKLEHAHFSIYVNAVSLSDTAIRLSQLYRYIRLLSEASQEDA